MSVRTGLIGEAVKASADSVTGFLIGAGSKLDYRATALLSSTEATGQSRLHPGRDTPTLQTRRQAAHIRVGQLQSNRATITGAERQPGFQ
ncbi:hypothetical protein ES703_54519 [subsurface metagenome]